MSSRARTASRPPPLAPRPPPRAPRHTGSLLRFNETSRLLPLDRGALAIELDDTEQRRIRGHLTQRRCSFEERASRSRVHARPLGTMCERGATTSPRLSHCAGDAEAGNSPLGHRPQQARRGPALGRSRPWGEQARGARRRLLAGSVRRRRCFRRGAGARGLGTRDLLRRVSAVLARRSVDASHFGPAAEPQALDWRRNLSASRWSSS
jgi:hypothetical protein